MFHRDCLDSSNQQNKNVMQLGAFSISLSVKDLATSQAFYEKLGFTVFGGSMEQHYLIMKNAEHLIGLFQGMFEGNILTFNPGWDQSAQSVDPFTDVREIEGALSEQDIALLKSVDENTEGPGSLMIMDPDGNVILIDQHR